MNQLRRLLEWWREVKEPVDVFDSDFPGDWVDRVPQDMGAPDTQPTSPGALDSDLGDLHDIRP